MKKLITMLLFVLLALGMQTTAFAVNPELPVAVDDEFTSTARGVVSGNVIKNDSWNSALTAKITDAELWSIKPYGNGSYADISFETSGMVSVVFSPYEGEGEPRVAEVGYTLTDSAQNFSTGRAVFTEKSAAVEPEVVEPEVVEPEAESLADSGSSDEKGEPSTAWSTSGSTPDEGSSVLISIVVAVVFVGFLAYEFMRGRK